MAALEADSTELKVVAGVFLFSEPRTSSPVVRMKVNKLRIRIKLRVTIRREKSTPPAWARGKGVRGGGSLHAEPEEDGIAFCLPGVFEPDNVFAPLTGNEDVLVAIAIEIRNHGVVGHLIATENVAGEVAGAVLS